MNETVAPLKRGEGREQAPGELSEEFRNILEDS